WRRGHVRSRELRRNPQFRRGRRPHPLHLLYPPRLRRIPRRHGRLGDGNGRARKHGSARSPHRNAQAARIGIMSETAIQSPDDRPVITFTRTFKAPRTLVWTAFTARDHVANWWGPRSIGPIEILEHDFTPGGRWRYVQ